MIPGSRIRITNASLKKENEIVSLQVIQSVTVLNVGNLDISKYLSKKQHRYQVVRGVSLSSLINPEFVRNNTETLEEADLTQSTKSVAKKARKNRKKSESHSTLVGVTQCCPLDHSNTALIIYDKLRLSVDTATHDSLGLTATRAAQAANRVPPLFRRTVAIDVPLWAPSEKLRQRAIWALSSDRIGNVDLVLSCGSAYVHPPTPNKGVENFCVNYQSNESAYPTDLLPDVRKIFDHGDDDDMMELVDFVQMMCANTGQELEEGKGKLDLAIDTSFTLEKDIDKGEMDPNVKVQVHQYVGFSNNEQARELGTSIQQAMQQEDICDKDAWCAMLVRGFADSPLLWRSGTGGVHRGGSAPGFGADAAEIIFLTPSRQPVIAQLRALPDIR